MAQTEANLVNEVLCMSDILDEVDYINDLVDPLKEDDDELDFSDDIDEDDEDFDDEEKSEVYDFPEEDPSTFEYVQHTIEHEGFHYAFDSYSNYDEVKDEEFHRLRTAYLVAAGNLEKYIKDNIK